MLQFEILDILEEGPKERKELIEVLGNEDLLDKALNRLVKAKQIDKPTRGIYALPAPSKVQADDDLGLAGPTWDGDSLLVGGSPPQENGYFSF